MKIPDIHTILYYLGLVIAGISAVAAQMGTDSKYGMALGVAVSVLSQARRFLDAYEVPDVPTTVINNPPAQTVKIVAPMSGTPDVPPKV